MAEAVLDGRPLRAGSPRAALAAGIAAVHQSPMLFERMTWEENLALGGFDTNAGAFLTLAYAGTFVENISAGRGFVALSVVIVGRWNSWGLAAASVLFGAAMALQFGLQALGTVVCRISYFWRCLMH